MNKKGLVTGIILLFIVSSISPIVLSNTIKISNTELNIKNTSEPLLKNKIYGKKSLNQTIDEKEELLVQKENNMQPHISLNQK
jgi:hypothetical protein